jgi:hypothetical protein
MLLKEVFADTERRKWYAANVENAQRTGFGMSLDQVPRTPSHDECYFCSFYRPSAADGIGCPGTVNA